MKKQERRHFTPEQKSKILREHHLDKVPVSDLCEKYKLQPSVFYGWQRALFERAPQVFVESRVTPAETVKRELGGKVEHLEVKPRRSSTSSTSTRWKATAGSRT
ncbi:transposase [Nannocystis pusilla]|uniref:Transposase n=1 Tax=Nannocystis pusilla TaxID=889268 RepID=A0ABS7TTY0_9BACT|nr:transposase [Nannocystis pusilla]MBZ5711697.1 transposase [Nannocystis pusilla]